MNFLEDDNKFHQPPAIPDDAKKSKSAFNRIVGRKGKYKNDAWRVLVMKYHNPNLAGVAKSEDIQKRVLSIKQKQDGYNPEAFPTMKKIAEHYGDLCPILEYSILPANSIIERHIGIENKIGENCVKKLI